MNVFVLTYDNTFLVGIYSSLYKAEKAAIETAEYQSQFGFHYIREIDHYDDGDIIGWYDYDNKHSLVITRAVVE